MFILILVTYILSKTLRTETVGNAIRKCYTFAIHLRRISRLRLVIGPLAYPYESNTNTRILVEFYSNRTTE